ncbi:MAG TPA: DegV family protein [Candidatus Pacearchaeota archaeon]|jgi:DegV family protein with EDD domain|nr:DegV family protein [Candidatus Pacearchaeota archaeon]HRR94870.1 DegV family protein [Candidatus Paceibacterota bacterium]HPC30757.1 DegV family protein [Candidatus Pacearchaeota archaeon]HQG09446.1 DegV family protein [Candidatus Pacearchaeota archaeon]HQH20291.1 DegV family protein [Candidatus Pacearchaeota archaeon]
MKTKNENKKTIGLVSDDMGDLPEDLINNNNISIVPFKIDYGNLAQFPGDVYQKIRAAEKEGIASLIKTSQPSINDFLKVFREKLEYYEKILCFTFSSKLSGAYNSALQAVKFLPAEAQKQVYVFDTLAGSASKGLMTLRAAQLVQNAQLKFDEIIQFLQKNIANFKLVATYDKPKWIEASGRLPSFIPFALNQAEARHIKPMFTLKDGKLSILGFKKTLNGVAAALFEEFEKQTKSIRKTGQKIKVAITHADNPTELEKLKNLIKNSQHNLELVYTNLICFPIGGHVGPGTLLLGWEQ